MAFSSVTQVGDRFGRSIPLALSGLLFLLVCAGLSQQFGWWVFLFLAAALSLGWNFVTAYQMGTIAALDPDGRYSVLIPAVQGAGAMLGPWCAGLVVTGQGYTSLLVGGAALITLSLTAFIMLNQKTSRADL